MNFFQAEKLRLAHLGLEITAALPEGQFVALLGPNGIGKTTLLRTLIGEEKIREGELRLFERPIFEISPQELSTTVAYVPQDHEYPMHLRVVDLLRYAFLPSTGWFTARGWWMVPVHTSSSPCWRVSGVPIPVSCCVSAGANWRAA